MNFISSFNQWLTDYEAWKIRKRDKAFLKHLKSDCNHFEEPDNIFCSWSWYFLNVKTQGLSVEILPSEFENIKHQKEIDERMAKIMVPLNHAWSIEDNEPDVESWMAKGRVI